FIHLYGFNKKERFFVLNCFLLGGWTGGLRFSSRVGSLASVKNIGPDPEKVIRCLRELGNSFTYLISGYPPFIIELLEAGKKLNDFNWKNFRIHIFAGGEGFAEEWREYVASQLQDGALIYSDYGAIDLDAGISVETPFSLALKKILIKDCDLRSQIFGSERMPCFLGQYSNQQYYIRNSDNNPGKKELEITVMNLKAVCPNIKYAIGDEGGVIGFQNLSDILEKNGYPIQKLKNDFKIKTMIAFPVIWIYGRVDGTVMIHGAMISPADISKALLADKELVSVINTFRLSVETDKDNLTKLFISVETRKDVKVTRTTADKISDVILTSLIESNECFRNSYRKNPDLHKPVIRFFRYRTGIFSESHDFTKHKYIK
ncbi:MAG: hypothetical protein HPY62_13640, partial [Bacteroidales bacterium]|nr:hypothetical protein [Bacteroidales bacterium]